MRNLIRLAVILAVLWCGWWMLAIWGMGRGVEAWFEEQRATGLRAEYSAATQAGFPFALKQQLTDVLVANPQTGVGLAASHIDIHAAAHWPGNISVALPDTPIQLFNPDGNLTLQAQDATVDLALRPGVAMALDSATSHAGGWKLGGAGGTVFSAKDWQVAVVQTPDTANTYQFTLSSDALTPGAVVRNALQLPRDWPLSFQNFEAQMQITFDRPLDRHASETTPQPRAINLQNAAAIWGALQFTGTGMLEVNAEGIPTGTTTLRAQNWREVLALASAAGAVPQGAMVQIETVLGMLANMSGKPENLDLSFTFEAGRMRMGLIDLGPAPKLVFQ